MPTWLTCSTYRSIESDRRTFANDHDDAAVSCTVATPITGRRAPLRQPVVLRACEKCRARLHPRLLDRCALERANAIGRRGRPRRPATPWRHSSRSIPSASATRSIASSKSARACAVLRQR